jgi:uncharacterized protein
VPDQVELRAYAELGDFLAPEQRGTTIRRPLRPHQTVKDLIEATGIPHTEIDLVVVDGEPVRLSYRPIPGDRIAVYPTFRTIPPPVTTRLQPPPEGEVRFVADVHLGRLARLLRLLGFDTRWANDLDDDTIAAISEDEGRIVLTRDRGLLKRSRVTRGVFVRSDHPEEQAVDVVRHLGLGGHVHPFGRCLRCGGPVTAVPKREVLGQLEPLTRRYHHEFHRCTACGQAYWSGSHHPQLVALVARICQAIDDA